MIRRAVLLLALVLSASLAYGQGTVTTRREYSREPKKSWLAWNHASPDYFVTVEEVRAYQFTLQVDGADPVVIVPICRYEAGQVLCRAPVVLTPGAHTFIVVASNDNGSASGSLDYP